MHINKNNGIKYRIVKNKKSKTIKLYILTWNVPTLKTTYIVHYIHSYLIIWLRCSTDVNFNSHRKYTKVSFVYVVH